MRSRLQLLVAVALLPDLDTLNLHGGRGPGGQPGVPGVPEVLLGIDGAVQPGLARLGVLEPAIGAAHGDVKDEEEALVKGGVGVGRFQPGVLEEGAVTVGCGEVAAIKEGLVKVGVQHLQEARVDIGEEILLGPLEAKGVEAGRVGGVQGRALVVGAPPAVVGDVGTPVEGG